MRDRSRSETVLIADDEPDLTDLFEIWLATRYEVRTAYDGEQTLEQMDEDVSIVFLDRRMPETSGDEVAKRLAETYPETRIVFVTGESLLKCTDAPFDAYLTKPVSRTTLLDVADRLITDPPSTRKTLPCPERIQRRP